MNASLKLCSSAAAVLAMGVLSSLGQAQVLTADTITHAITAGNVLWNGATRTQTFTGADALGDVTFRFLVDNSFIGSMPAMTINLQLTGWGGGNSLGNDLGSGAYSLPSESSWTDSGSGVSFFDSTFDMSTLGPISAGNTYGITLFGNSDTENYEVMVAYAPGSAYTDGLGYDGAANFGDLNAMMSGNNLAWFGFDYAFSASASSAPVPEASTAAVLFAGVFVGGLMVRRRRRQPADLVVAQA